MKLLLAWIGLLLCCACSPRFQPEDVQHISGYWQIEHAQNPKAAEVDYNANSAYDFWQVQHGRGFRQKMVVHWSGIPESNGLRETLMIREIDGQWYVQYRTPYSQWKEQLIQCNDSVLELENAAGIRFRYKRFTPKTSHHG